MNRTLSFDRPRHPLMAPRLRNHPLPLVHRLPEERQETPPDPLARTQAVAWVEAALMAADEPLPARKLAQAAGLKGGTEARQVVRALQALYEAEGSAFEVQEIAGGFQLLTRPEFHPWLMRLRRSNTDLKLSGPARETLAIIAYRQPIGRADIEAIRGVQCSEVLRQLMEKNLIRITGRDTSLGRPVLYGTTKKFLQAYGLKSLRDLPDIGEARRPPSDDVEG